MIVLFTDFGLAGPYTGQVNAVLQRDAPGVPIIQLFADAPAGHPKPAGYLLAAYATWFPAATIFLCVVDPGVGGDRRALIVEADDRLYVGPDNGLFELVRRRAAAAPRCWEIAWRPPFLSASFHGRDLFAPVAARLARGEAPPSLAQPAAATEYRDWPDDLGEIVYIDHYGNALTGLRGANLPESATIVTGGIRGETRAIGHAAVFSAAAPGTAFWYVNSNGLVEIAVSAGRADQALGLAVASPVAIE